MAKSTAKADPRNIRFNMVVTASEQKAIRAAAKRAGLKMSAWVRKTLAKAWG